jgi:hypothetical protein
VVLGFGSNIFSKTSGPAIGTSPALFPFWKGYTGFSEHRVSIHAVCSKRSALREKT